MRKVHGQQLATLMLTSSEYFVLDLMVQNMESRQMEMVSNNFMENEMVTTNFLSQLLSQVLEEVEKQYKRRAAQKLGKMSDSLPSVRMILCNIEK